MTSNISTTSNRSPVLHARITRVVLLDITKQPLHKEPQGNTSAPPAFLQTGSRQCKLSGPLGNSDLPSAFPPTAKYRRIDSLCRVKRCFFYSSHCESKPSHLRSGATLAVAAATNAVCLLVLLCCMIIFAFVDDPASTWWPHTPHNMGTRYFSWVNSAQNLSSGSPLGWETNAIAGVNHL